MAYGTKASYSDTTTQVRNVVEDFDVLSPTEVPLLKWIAGGSDEKPSLNNLDAPCTMTKFEWIEDTDPAHTTTLGAAFADTSGTALNLASGIADLVDGQLILVDSEQMLVTATTGANTATVSRGWGGTTAATHSNGATVTFIGSAHKEGADAPAAINSFPTMPYNYVQEFTKTILLTEIEQAINRYGIDKALDYETTKRARQLYIDMEKQCFYGKRVLGTSSVPATFGGIESYIPAANIVAGAGGDLTAAMVMNAMQLVYNQIGTVMLPDTIVCSSKARRKLSILFSGYNATTFRETADRDGGVKIDTITTDFGDLNILMSNWCPNSKLFLLRKDKLGLGPLVGNEMRREMLAKTGTSDKFMISGAYTLQVRAGASHALVDNIVPNP